MAQKKTKTSKSNREERLKEIAEILTNDAKAKAKDISYVTFGADKNKSRKNDEACTRGGSTGPARYCSKHLRPIYPADILGDRNKSEFCVEGRKNNFNNPCKLCGIDINNNNYIKTERINFAKALFPTLDDSNISNRMGLEQYNRALQSFLIAHMGSNYPGTNGDKTVLRIKVNGAVWIEYYIKLTFFSALLKTSAPSGYKYKDRISVGRTIKIQGNSNDELIFFIEKDGNYNDPEKEASAPVVNCVGFWNLLKAPKPGEIRNIVHLNQEQAVNVSFGFLINHNNNINKIEVELVCTRNSLSMENEAIPLWTWPNNNNDDNQSMDAAEHKSNASPSLSPYLTSPINMGYNTLSPQISRIPYPLESNNTYQQPQVNYINDAQQQQQQAQQFAVTAQPQLPLPGHNDYGQGSLLPNNNGMSLGYYGHHGANYSQNRYDPYHQTRTVNNINTLNLPEFPPESAQPPPTTDNYNDDDPLNSFPPTIHSSNFPLDNFGAASSSMPPLSFNDNESIFTYY